MTLVDVSCKKCGGNFQMDIGNKTLDEVKVNLEKQDGFECPGHHVEFGSPLNYWTFGELHEGKAPTEDEWCKQMREKYGEIYSTDELDKKFRVTGFSYGLCMAEDKETGEKVVLDFSASPKGKRYYYK